MGFVHPLMFFFFLPPLKCVLSTNGRGFVHSAKNDEGGFVCSPRKHPGSVVQSIVSLASLLMTNSLTVVAKIFSDTLIFLLQKCELLLQCKSYSHFSAKKYQCICHISR